VVLGHFGLEFGRKIPGFKSRDRFLQTTFPNYDPALSTFQLHHDNSWFLSLSIYAKAHGI
jgi:hypothetical protein